VVGVAVVEHVLRGGERRRADGGVGEQPARRGGRGARPLQDGMGGVRMHHADPERAGDPGEVRGVEQHGPPGAAGHTAVRER
jgi:hypothetical protein